MRTFSLFSMVSFVALSFTASVSAADPAPNALSDEEAKAGWKVLFDGKALDGWRIYNGKGTGNWAAKDGNLVLEKPGSGDLMTEAKYGDFELSLEWKFEEGNNSGIIYRVVETKGPSYETGPEMQVTPQKSTDKLGKNAGGSLYDLYAPSANSFKGGDDWTRYRIVAKGKHLEHWVNGIKVVDCDIGSDDWNSRYAASKWKDLKDFAAAKSGHIALQDHGGKIAYRNVKIRELK